MRIWSDNFVDLFLSLCIVVLSSKHFCAVHNSSLNLNGPDYIKSKPKPSKILHHLKVVVAVYLIYIFMASPMNILHHMNSVQI